MAPGDMYWKAACPLACRASAPDILISLIAGYESCIYKCSSTLLDLSLFLAYTAALDITASTVDYLFCKHLYVKWKVVISLKLEDTVCTFNSRVGNRFVFEPWHNLPIWGVGEKADITVQH